MASRDADLASFTDDFPSLKAKWVVMQRAPRRSSAPFDDLAFVPDHDILDTAWLNAAGDPSAPAKPLPVSAADPAAPSAPRALPSASALRDGELDDPAAASQNDLLAALGPAGAATDGAAAALFRDDEDEMESWLQYSVEGSAAPPAAAAAAADVKSPETGDGACRPSGSTLRAVRPTEGPAAATTAASPSPDQDGAAANDGRLRGDGEAALETPSQASVGDAGVGGTEGAKSNGEGMAVAVGGEEARGSSAMAAPVSPQLLPPPSPKEPSQQSAEKPPRRQPAQLPGAHHLPQPLSAASPSAKCASPPLNFSHFSRPAALYSRAHAKGLSHSFRGSAPPRVGSAAGDSAQWNAPGSMLPPLKSPSNAVARKPREGAAGAQAAVSAGGVPAPANRWCGRAAAGNGEGGGEVGSASGAKLPGGDDGGSSFGGLAMRKGLGGMTDTGSADVSAAAGNCGTGEPNRAFVAGQRVPYAPLAASMAGSAERQRQVQSYSASAGGAGGRALTGMGAAAMRCNSANTGAVGERGKGSMAGSVGAGEADRMWPGRAEGGTGMRNGEERVARALREMKERSAWTSNTWGSRDESGAWGGGRKRKAFEGSECGKSEDMREESADTRRTGGAGEAGGAGKRSMGGASVSGREGSEGSAAKRARAAHVHNLSERRRRDRINERMKALQELIPNSNKTDKASVLDEAIDYLKMLQLQLHVMSLRTGISIPPALAPTPAALSSLAASPSPSASPSLSLSAVAAQIAAPTTPHSRAPPSSLPAATSPTAAALQQLAGSGAAAGLPSEHGMGGIASSRRARLLQQLHAMQAMSAATTAAPGTCSNGGGGGEGGASEAEGLADMSRLMAGGGVSAGEIAGLMGRAGAEAGGQDKRSTAAGDAAFNIELYQAILSQQQCQQRV
ncbi:unnamed protein product [Closterium sp. NIES-65]|nr:unnamed protein product [Closterium sp. NIES-65]